MDWHAIKTANKWAGGLAVIIIALVGLAWLALWLPAPWGVLVGFVMAIAAYWILVFSGQRSLNIRFPKQ